MFVINQLGENPSLSLFLCFYEVDDECLYNMLPLYCTNRPYYIIGNKIH